MRNRLSAIRYKEGSSRHRGIHFIFFLREIYKVYYEKDYNNLKERYVMKNNENVKERKSFKEVVVENKGKIAIVGGAVVSVTLGVVLAKNYKGLAKQLTSVDAKTDLGALVSKELWEKVEATENIVVNSGIIDQARATITRKRDNLAGKLNRYINMEQGTPDIDKLIEEVKAGISGFDKMLDQCDELEFLYKARTVAENVLEEHIGD